MSPTKQDATSRSKPNTCIWAMETTSCAFAGPELNRLYLTTATEDWSDEQRRAEPRPASPIG